MYQVLLGLRSVLWRILEFLPPSWCLARHHLCLDSSFRCRSSRRRSFSTTSTILSTTSLHLLWSMVLCLLLVRCIYRLHSVRRNMCLFVKMDSSFHSCLCMMACTRLFALPLHSSASLSVIVKIQFQSPASSLCWLLALSSLLCLDVVVALLDLCTM